MKKKIFKRYPVLNFFFFLFLLASCCLSEFIFFNLYKNLKDLSSSSNIKILSCSGTNILQSQESFCRILTENEELKDGDVIKTEKNSSAIIEINSSMKLFLQENTSIRIKKSSRKICAEYINGFVTVQNASESDSFIIIKNIKIVPDENSTLEIFTEEEFLKKQILSIKKGRAEYSEINQENPFAQPAFLLPPAILNAEETVALFKHK